MATIQKTTYAVCCWDGAVGIDAYRDRIKVKTRDPDEFARSKNGRDHAVFAFYFVDVVETIVVDADDGTKRVVDSHDENVSPMYYPNAVVLDPGGWTPESGDIYWSKYKNADTSKSCLPDDEVLIRRQDGEVRAVKKADFHNVVV